MPEASDIAANLTRVRASIAAAAERAGRAADAVSLVAVSKTQEEAKIAAAIAAGQQLFGENRVQEAKGKWPELKIRHPDVRLHLIGPLQTNKVGEAVKLFDAIESVDREKLARALAAEMGKQDREIVVYAQVNVGRERQKSGVAPEGADALIALSRELKLRVEGLMCIPPEQEDPAPHFALLAEIARRNGLQKLSMGMSGDFETAIAEGATHVRVGAAIFGPRG